LVGWKISNPDLCNGLRGNARRQKYYAVLKVAGKTKWMLINPTDPEIASRNLNIKPAEHFMDGGIVMDYKHPVRRPAPANL